MPESRLKKIVGVICILALASMLYFMAQDAMSVGKSGYSPGDSGQPPAIDWTSPLFFP